MMGFVQSKKELFQGEAPAWPQGKDETKRM